ncbi:hypothetical protein QA640_44315 (plasmid) [Bradyrhizobium sp. CB82]|uniref:hypothetical protein n=1 Tax=Bradyrhizobium sp. CB82 TaxID=3039159 RepID=UPI0024B17C1C|nr:hypothetical protein [Bradyrhizobium sp. CB82]WFU45842.1 hypothetical protein QA640_44315 [Bradyrhizobium sp. CB82]
MSARPILKQSSTFEYRLAQEAINLRQQASGMPAGIRRTELLRKAKQIDVAGRLTSADLAGSTATNLSFFGKAMNLDTALDTNSHRDLLSPSRGW